MRYVLCALLCLCALCDASQLILPGDGRIQIQGAKYVFSAESGLRFQRHREDVLKMPAKELGLNADKARNTTGVVIAFKTDSRNVRLRFRILSANYMGAMFGVYENGTLIKEYKYKPQEKEAVFEFRAGNSGASLYEVALPSFADVEFQGLEVDEGATLLDFPNLGKKVYVALGDSISHGTGQDGATHKTWPFLLARKLDCELFNLAVGGGKISVPSAEMLKDWEKIDLLTILIGYNDLHFDGKTPDQYREKYEELLDAVRRCHPETKIICITPLYTKKTVSEKTGATIDQFRDELTALVKKRQTADNNLILIDGNRITSEKNLRGDHPEDPVHLSVEGAALLADELVAAIPPL